MNQNKDLSSNPKKNFGKLVGVIVGVVLLLLVLGLVSFFVIRTFWTKNDSSSSAGLSRRAKKGSAGLPTSDSQDSISAESSQESEIDLTSSNGKPAVTLQTVGASNPKRAGNTMVINEDV